MNDMVKIPAWSVPLIVGFLDDLGDRMSTAGCNDYTVPDGVPIDKLRAAIKAWNNTEDDEDDVGSERTDWVVVGAMRHIVASAEP